MALHLDPEHASAHNSRGLIRTRLGQLDPALADFGEAIRLAPDWFLPYLHRAQTHHGLGRFDAALADYDRAIELAGSAGDPMVALAYCRRGEARYDQFQEVEAEADFAEARRRDVAAAGYLGEMWLRRNKPDRALEAFAEYVHGRPDDVRGYVGRGAAREALGDLEGADADYSTAVGLQPEGDGHVRRAHVRHRQGRLDEALADLSQYIGFHPDDPAGYLNRSVVYRQRGALAEALQDLNAAHRAAPKDPWVCNNLAWMLATCSEETVRDGPRAVALAREACQATEWKHPFCMGTLAAALAETGAFEEAVRWQSRALPLYSKQGQAAAQARLELYRGGQPYRE
jgi:tetratricopeptide (TPR) repeat protein